jgi:ketosteroid isomerase-like protein
MAHPNEDLVREIFAAFGRGDLETLRSRYMAEDACFHYPGRGPHGKAAEMWLYPADLYANDEFWS